MYGDGNWIERNDEIAYAHSPNTSPFFHTIITGFDLALKKDGVNSKDAVNGSRQVS